MTTKTHPSGISATIIKDSIYRGNRMTTFEFVFPRWILAEVNTHRMLSKNAASSRAVPAADYIKGVLDNPAMPVHWGTNNPGMVSKAEMSDLNKTSAKALWVSAMRTMVNYVQVLSDKMGINGHKQFVNRLIENFTFTKQVISGTEWENFFWLRDHPDAQPEFQVLAALAHEAYKESVPVELKPGQWHLPYVDFDGNEYTSNGVGIPLDVAQMISISCCAQVSYRKLDDSTEKAQKILGMLNIGSSEKPAHASPLEHLATPMNIRAATSTVNWEQGVTHMTRDSMLWSGNLKGWIQYRKLTQNEAKW